MNTSHNGNHHRRWEDEAFAIQTELNPVNLVQLQMLQGKAVLGLALWQDSIADEELEEEVTEEDRVFVDFDLYLEGRDLLELYAATVYRDAEIEPIAGLNSIADALGHLTEQGAVLNEVAADEEDGLVLVLAAPNGERLLIAPSGWVLAQWSSLPDEAMWEE